MMRFVSTISCMIETTSLKRRVVKFLGMGKSDIQTSLQASSYGIDSSPIKDMVAVYSETKETGKTVIVGYLNKNQLAESGEIRLYSTDNNGTLKGYVWVKNDGKVFLNGEDFGGLIKIESLIEKINSNTDILNDFILKYNTHTHAETGSNTGIPSSVMDDQAADIERGDIENTKVKHG